MGQASRLFVKEIEVQAIFVANKLLPQDLKDLPFNWETEGNLSKLLDIFIGKDLSPLSM